jgi:cell wall-associated NlpC family hydrolase
MGVRDDIVAYCQRAIGCSYDYAPSGGIEGRSYNCSFLSTCAYRAAGLQIPHWQGHQNGNGSQSDWVRWHGHWTTDPDELMPGDLVFFGSSPYDTGHVGVSLGGWDMIDSVPNGGVQERTLYGSFVGGGWPLEDLPGDMDGRFPVQKAVRFKKRIPVRSAPDGTTSANVVGHYGEGELCVIDGIVINAETNRVWGTYTGASGKRRYVSLGTHEAVEVL